MSNSKRNLNTHIKPPGWNQLPVDVDTDTYEGSPEKPKTISQQRIVYLIVAITGAIGALTRYLVGNIISVSHSGFPWNTFTINMTGTFLLAFVMVLVLEKFQRSALIRPLIATGFCGAYTTFSTFMVDAALLIKYNDYKTAVLYLLLSLLGGLLVAVVGMYSARFLCRLDLVLTEGKDTVHDEKEDVSAVTYQDS